MNIAVKKVEIIEWLVQLKDESLLKKIEKLKNQSIKDSYESKLKPMTSKSYKAMLRESEEDYLKGRVTTQDNLEREVENW